MTNDTTRMPVLRIGVDMIAVARVEMALARHGQRFLDKCFTPAERAACGGQAQRLAARFAAKEATGKALGTGIGDVRWVEIEVSADLRGRPLLRLEGAAAALAVSLGVTTWEISLSHTNDLAVAFVVGMG